MGYVRSMGVRSGLVDFEVYFTEMCMQIWFDSWLCLILDILVESYSWFIFKEEAKEACCLVHNLWTSETVVSGYGYVNTRVSVYIVARFWGC